MGLVGWILVAVLVLGGAVAWLMKRYPGGLRYAFSTEYAEDRHELDVARSRLHEAERAAGRERDRAHSAVKAAERAHRDRVNQARDRLARLQDPDRGILRSSLGDSFRLYEHALEVTVDGRTAEYPLHDIAIRDEYSGKAGHVYVTLPTGRQKMVIVPLEETPEAEARGFVVAVYNAVANAKASKAERQALVPQAEAELRDVIADTAGQEQAQSRLADLLDRQKSDVRIPQARHEWNAACERWQQLTGHRP
ncbi:hypothetical protein E6W39_02585 [Kitasatospora acidiphila]|uniref:Uncharacterized protein n=1 Tax=Kitasatospora acidiphila TaxID=2567942 RepID=A0A540VX42_9ACTN|nr:hypothetical protein [Kitasatospora acidiphila]TQF01328.1 hypothetical protein E6W39_02585 [Kitasatospora acidiphila]